MADLPPNLPPAHKLPYRSWRDDFGGSFRRFAASVTRENVISNLKTLAWVIPLTLLIWVWAEREQVQRAPDVAVPFELTSIDPARVIALKSPQDNNLVLELSGPMARLQELLNRLRGGTMPQGLKLEVPTSYAVNHDYTVVTMDLVSRQRIFRDYGVTVLGVQPLRLEISIDELVDRDAKIILPPNLKNAKATFDPPTVKVRGPRDLLERAAANTSGAERGQLVVHAATDAIPKAPGHYEADVAVVAPDELKDDRVRLNETRARVHAVVDVRQSDRTYMKPSMPCTIDAPVGTYSKVDIVVDRPAVQNVTFIGPPEIIDAMQKPDFEPQPKARLVITQADVSVLGTHSKVVQYDNLPEGVHVSPDDKKKTIEFKVVDRAATATP